MNLHRIVAAVYSQTWALLPAVAEAMMEIIHRRAGGQRLLPQEIAVALEPSAARAEARNGVSINGGVQMLPMYGLISNRAYMVEDVSSPGGTSTEKFGRLLDQALADPNVSAIVIDVDSPGGSVNGVQELADKIYNARATKPIVAVANSLAASAAYWLASAATELVMAPGAEIGSVGVFAMHIDQSKFNELAGLKPTYISAGKYKIEGNPMEPLADEARTFLQSRVDEYYGDFTKSLARNRGVTVSAVRGGFGEGRVVGGAQAVRENMADRIDTLDNTIARLSRPANRTRLMQGANARARDLRLLEIT